MYSVCEDSPSKSFPPQIRGTTPKRYSPFRRVLYLKAVTLRYSTANYRCCVKWKEAKVAFTKWVPVEHSNWAVPPAVLPCRNWIGWGLPQSRRAGDLVGTMLSFGAALLLLLPQEIKLISEQNTGETNPLFQMAINPQPPHSTWTKQ